MKARIEFVVGFLLWRDSRQEWEYVTNTHDLAGPLVMKSGIIELRTERAREAQKCYTRNRKLKKLRGF